LQQTAAVAIRPGVEGKGKGVRKFVTDTSFYFELDIFFRI